MFLAKLVEATLSLQILGQETPHIKPPMPPQPPSYLLNTPPK